jgi:hypothetical protein
VSWWAMCLASVTGMAAAPLPVRLDVVAVDVASQAHVSELRAWLQAALEQEGVRLIPYTSRARAMGEPVRLLVVELREGQWRVWTAEAPDAAVAIDASDYSLASLEALHQASLLLKEQSVTQVDGPATESAEFAAGAPVNNTSSAPKNDVAKATLPKDVGLDEAFAPAVPARQLWVDVNLGFVVSGRTNLIFGLDGALYQTPNWGAVANIGVHHVTDFSSFDESWNLSIWNYRVSAGPMFSVPLGERLRFSTALEVGMLVHTYDFTGEGWGARVNALANVPLAFAYQGRDWRGGITGNILMNSATFTHRVFGAEVWETEQLSAVLMASVGRQLW